MASAPSMIGSINYWQVGMSWIRQATMPRDQAPGVYLPGDRIAAGRSMRRWWVWAVC
jgi:hypothetical protein